MYTGIDIGSRLTKIIFRLDKKIEHFFLDTINFYKDLTFRSNNKLCIDFKKLEKLYKKEIILEKLGITGYGRQLLSQFSFNNVFNEIKAHASGVFFLTELSLFTLLDIGGQDTKVSLVKNGKLKDFRTNDKCGAGSGRFLENMARILNLELNDIFKYYKDPVKLNSTCAIFSESEIIGLISEGFNIKNIAAGVNLSLFEKIKPLLKELFFDKIVFTGGLANNKGLIHFIEKEFNTKVIIPEDYFYSGAIGASILAEKNLFKN